MVLSDRTIKAEIAAGRLVFDPYDESLVQPSSVDVRVDAAFRVFHNSRHPYIDVRQPMDDLTELVRVEDGEPFVLHPGEFVLGQTLERVQLPDDLVARLEGKSSLGRLGLVIHSTAGFVDPGFEGNLTLELSNVANLPITIYEGMPIGQISFMRMDGPVEHAYGKARPAASTRARPSPRRAATTSTSPRGQWGGPGQKTREKKLMRLPLVAYHSRDAQYRTTRDRDCPRHRADRLRAQAPAGARQVAGRGDPRVPRVAER